MKPLTYCLLVLGLIFSGSASAAINPVSVYCFDDANNIGKDCKGTDNGSTVGIPPLQAPGWISEGAIFGDDSSSYISVPPSAAQNFKTGFSVSFWMSSQGSYIHAFPVRKGLLALAPCSPGTWFFDASLAVGVGVHIEDLPQLYYGNLSYQLSGAKSIAPDCTISDESGTRIGEPVTIKASAWRHYIWTADVRTGLMKLYVDGILKFSISGFNRQSLAAVNSSALEVGRSGGAVLDDVRVFNVPMTDADASAQWTEARLSQPIANASLLTHCLFGGFCARPSNSGAHTGLDYMASAGTSVYSLCGGTVDRIRLDSAYYNQVIRIHHDNSNCGPIRGKWAYYGHVTPETNLAVGAIISKGQKIGTLMDWGTNSHLHLAVSKNQITAGWGYHTTAATSEPNCRQSEVIYRSAELKKAGFIDIADLAASNRWQALPLLTTYGRCAYTGEGLFEQTPYGIGIQYLPFYLTTWGTN